MTTDYSYQEALIPLSAMDGPEARRAELSEELPPERDISWRVEQAVAEMDGLTLPEMILATARRTREMLDAVNKNDAHQFLVGWPSVVDAAASLWDACEQPGAKRDPAMMAVTTRAQLVYRGLTNDPSWPAAGTRPDGKFEILAAMLEATAMKAAQAAPDPKVSRDVQLQTLHVLLLASHHLTASLTEAQAQWQWPRTKRMIGEWVAKVRPAEDAVSRYLPQDRDEGSTRLSAALVRWDLVAHRTLVTDPRPINVALVGRVQQLIASASDVVLSARADLEHAAQPPVDGHCPTHRTLTHGPAEPMPGDELRTRLREAVPAWGEVAGRWADMTRPTDTVAPDLARCAREVRESFAELNLREGRLATSEAITTHPDFERAVVAIARAVEVAPDLVLVMDDLAREEGWSGPAYALSKRVCEDVELTREFDDIEEAWVSPADVGTNRTVPLPEPSQIQLIATTRALYDVAYGAQPAALALTPPARWAVPAEIARAISPQRPELRLVPNPIPTSASIGH